MSAFSWRRSEHGRSWSLHWRGPHHHGPMRHWSGGAAGAAEASAQSLVPTPTHLIVGPPIDIPSQLRLANSAGSQTLVTPSQAREVTVSMWQLWESALISRNTTALAQLIPPGPLLTGEAYNCAWPSGGCVAETSPRPMNNVTTIVSGATQLPDLLSRRGLDDPGHRRSQFWTGPMGTLGRTPSSDEGQRVGALAAELRHRLRRHRSPTAPSPSLRSATVFLIDAQLPARLVQPAADQRFIHAIADVLVPPGAVLPELQGHRESTSDDRFAVGGAAFGYGSQLAENRQDNIALGSRNHYDFSADPSAGEWEFSGAGGLPIECGTVLDTSTNTPAGGPVLFQNVDRTNWGMALPPGTYSKIITTTTHPTCVDDVDGVLDAAGDSGYSTGVTGPNGPPSRRRLSSVSRLQVPPSWSFSASLSGWP